MWMVRKSQSVAAPARQLGGREGVRVVEYMGCYAAAPSVVRERWGGQLEETVQPKRDFTVNSWSRVWPQKSAGMETRARDWRERTGRGRPQVGGQGGVGMLHGVARRPAQSQQGTCNRRMLCGDGQVLCGLVGQSKRALEREGTRVQEGRGPREDFWWEAVGGSAVYGVARWPCGSQARPKSNKRVTLLRRHRVCGGRHACRARRTATGMDEKGVRGSRELNREMGVEHANTRGVQ